MTSAESERAAVVAWLVNEALRGEAPIPDGLWRMSFWALLHPRKFAREHARLLALTNAIDAIERGDHLKGQSDG